MSLPDHLGQHAAWRRDFAQRLRQLSGWLRDHDLLHAGVEERLLRLESQVRDDKVMVAFVAEFSRGKSELINAIFFPGHGRRIMPATAGRTTMCPTELGWDAARPAGLMLLPIETRLQQRPLAEWRLAQAAWTRIDIDPRDTGQLAEAMEKVCEVVRVGVEQARDLGLWHDDAPDDNPPLGDDGQVEVPRWRHALVNLPHPLLQQGLVILDTPGLNAIGAEPELTVGLLPQAHAVVFLLGADTGVTRSDLAVWRDHLGGSAGQAGTRLAVLNKIDTLWDPLRSPQEVQAQVERQRMSTAAILELPLDQVLPVSAQKGLLAKLSNDTELLVASRLPQLELALSQGLVGRRQHILREAVAAAIAELQSEAGRAIAVRRRELSEQMLELRGLRGKNQAVIHHQRGRIAREQAEFDASGARIQAVRSIHMKLLRQLLDLLGADMLRQAMGDLAARLQQPGLKLGARRAYEDAFLRLRESMAQAQRTAGEIQTMLGGVFQQLNTEFGFTLAPPKAPDLDRYLRDLELVERSHLQYVGVTQVLRLAQPGFADRLARALTSRLRSLQESALAEVELWNKSAAAQLDAQLRERRRSLARRLEAVERIERAAAGLEERLSELESQEQLAEALAGKLAELTAGLASPPVSAAERQPAQVRA